MRHRVLVGAAVTVTTAVIVAACSDLPTPPRRHVGRPGASSSADLTTSSSTDSPQLLACAPPDSEQQVEGTIGPAGGSLAVGATRIDIPPGAVTTSTDFELEIPRTAAVRVEIHADGYSSFTFRQPAAITIDYSRCAGAVPAGALIEGVYIDSTSNQVLQRMGATVDSTAQTLSFWTGHLSGYAVAY